MAGRKKAYMLLELHLSKIKMLQMPAPMSPADTFRGFPAALSFWVPNVEIDVQPKTCPNCTVRLTDTTASTRSGVRTFPDSIAGLISEYPEPLRATWDKLQWYTSQTSPE
jgi:hypothetical protein|mmetsp:Transcript_16548/g.26911  ORF Transcript_16548/g.26911 Transcript_16548/m.26911 type:complete len:110 (-) Transcript_16548:2132-2461(-)